MTINTTLAGLSTNPALNGPDGGSDLPSQYDDAIRYALSFIATLRDSRGTFSGYVSYSTNTTLTAANAGQLINTGAANLTLTLPLGSTMRAGDQITFISSVAYTLLRQGSDSIVGPTGGTVTSQLMFGNCSIMWSGSLWVIVLGGEQQVLGAPGRFQFPGGLLLQWGSTVVTLSGGVGLVTFPLAFSSLYTVLVCNGDAAGGGSTAPATVYNQSTGAFNAAFLGGGAAAVRVNWLAIGRA